MESLRFPPSLDRLVLRSGSPSIDELSIRVNDPLDRAFLLEMRDGATSERSIDLHAVDQGRGGDDSISWDFLHDSIAVWRRLRQSVRDLKIRHGGKTV